jgi:adenine phosphoribosyltransferase
MNFKALIRQVPDFPKEGILFIDITTLLKDKDGYKALIDSIAEYLKDKGIEYVIGPEARGFAVGSPVAYALGAGFVPVRKKGKLPAETLQIEYGLEYGTDILQIHKDALPKGARVAVVDDLLATGGTAKAVCSLVEKCGAVVASVVFAIELDFLHGRDVLTDYDVKTFIEY